MGNYMEAMVLDGPGGRLVERRMPQPRPGPGEILVRVHACGVCRTDLHIVDGDLVPPSWPVIPGHEVVGHVAALGDGVEGFSLDERVGVAWLGGACGECEYCLRGQENLCPKAEFTGFSRPGGYAQYLAARADFVYRLPPGEDLSMAPLLCAGLIGYRTWRLAGQAERVGLYGFGAAAHILAQILRIQGKRVYAFTRPGDERTQAFARRLGAAWAGGSDEMPPEPLDAALLFAPVGALVPAALAAVRPGGSVVCGGIHMSDIPRFPYSLLWGERRLCSVANLTRADGVDFFRVARESQLDIETHPYPLGAANEALDDLRAGRFEGAAVLAIDGARLD